jgi:broad specificity phosphatase PhoE
VSDSRIRITLVRHGESTANRTMRWQGQGDSPLSSLGRSQAQALATRLGGRAFSLIVASDLERASATARALGQPFERNASFREFDIGAWEGLTREQVAERFGDELNRLDAGEDVALGGGESYASFCARVDGALARLRARLSAGDHALVVCHGGVIGALISGALGLRGTRELPIARAFNTSISQLSFDADGHATVQVFNDSLHLAALDLFPHPVETAQSLALVCQAAPHASFGVFAAHYDFDRHAHELALLPPAGLSFRALLERMRTRHPSARVALSAAAANIHAWAGETLFREPELHSRIAVPQSGTLCHVALVGARPMLVDYGVAV